MYNLLNKKSINDTYQLKWSQELNLIEDNDTFWNRIHKACSKSLDDNYVKWLQYRIIHRKLGTRHLLHLMGISNTGKCR